MTLSRIVLWRHGQSDHNAEGRWQGQLDTMLTELGRAQAKAAAAVLAEFQPSLVIASDLRRAADTARIFTDATGVALRVDKRLRETSFGEWQGRTVDEVEGQWPGMVSAWRSDPMVAPPGGETRVDVAARAREVIDELDAELTGTILICAHGGTIIALTASLLGLSLDAWPLLRRNGNCHWSVLDRRPGFGPRWGLAAYNVGLS